MIWGGQNSIAYLSVLVIYVCLKREKKISLFRLVLQIFPSVWWPNYTQKSRACAQSHSLTFLKLGRYAYRKFPVMTCETCQDNFTPSRIPYFFGYKTGFPFQNNPKKSNPSLEMPSKTIPKKSNPSLEMPSKTIPKNLIHLWRCLPKQSQKI